MKKLLFFILLFFVGMTFAFAQAPTHEQLTYQTVVRNAQNQLVFSQDNITVKVYVCSDAAGSNVVYSETHTGLSTNANGMLSLMIGSVAPDEGTWDGIDWSTAYIKTTISYGSETITHDPAPVTAVPYALSAGNMSNITNVIGDAIHDSIVNNISEQIHDSIANNVTTTNICTTIETNCDNVPLKNGDNAFTGTNTVPRGFDINTTDESNCNNVVVNACDLFAVFDSLNTRFNAVYDSLARLAQALEDLMNSVPPTANAPTMSDVSSNAMTATAHATSTGAPITSYEFCISTNSDMSGATCQTVPAADADHYTFTGLTGNTNYYVQYKATNVAGTTASPIVQQRTPAHAPTATVNTPESTKPAGFKVEVTNIDPKESTTDPTVQVCYVAKGSECPDKESTDYADCSVVTGTADTIISVTGLTPSTEYCAIVKVSNEDSTTIYGPWSVTTGTDVTMTISAPSDTTLCGAETINVPFTATITGDNASDFTYTWSAGTSTTHLDTVSLGATSTITVTATHATEGYTLTASHTVTVQNGTAVSFGLCEWDGVVTVKTVSGAPNSIVWGDGNEHNGTVTANSTSNTYSTSGTYTITASNATCSKSMTMTINVPDGTGASRTVKPCTAASMGSHAAQTGSAYTGNGFGGANYGLETVNGDAITSVTDYDGNEYPVVQIGSQCWLAENLRCTHSPKTGSYLVGTALANSLGSKLALWHNNDESTYAAKRYGILYNWCAAMDTANPTNYVEVVTTSDNNNNSFNFTPSGNHQGVCPLGWHVPTDAEWSAMELEVNGSDVSGSTGWRGSHGGKLATGCDWRSNGAANAPGNYSNAERNASGFSAVPVGGFNGSSFFSLNYANFWCASQSNSSNAWDRYMLYDNAGMNRGSNRSKSNGFSVRCVRDTATLSVSAASGTVKLCGGTTAEAVFTATPSSGDASDYTYTWSTGATASGNTATYSLGEGTHTVYVTATHTSPAYTLVGMGTVTVETGGTTATLILCENPSSTPNLSTITISTTNCTSFSWKNSSDVEVSTSATELTESGTIPAGIYMVTGVNASGCSVTKQAVLGNYTTHPCTSTSMGSHAAQTTGIGNEHDGKETSDARGLLSVKDYDGNEYPVVQIGSQCWTAVNLRTTHYADGSDIPAGTPPDNSSNTAPFYYNYESSIVPFDRRGYLYNWPATMKSTTTEGTQGVCPTGWHVPTQTEWQTMVAEAGASTSTGAVYLANSCMWSSITNGLGGMTPNSYNNPERNSSGFSAVPAGYLESTEFKYMEGRAYFWSSTVRTSGTNSWGRQLTYSGTDVTEYFYVMSRGMSVRCVRD